jgi:predicted enzyme related to lactoylglutathione lyase
MSHSVTWFQIQGQDPAALHKFYTDVFAWKLSPLPDASMRVEKQKDGIAGGIGQSPSGAPSVSIYVTCDDIDAQLAKAEAAGGKTALSKSELPDGMGYIAGFTDPAGNFIGLWQSAKPAQKKQSKAKAPKEKKPAKAAKADKPEKQGKADKKAKKADKKAKKADKKAKKADKS